MTPSFCMGVCCGSPGPVYRLSYTRNSFELPLTSAHNRLTMRTPTLLALALTLAAPALRAAEPCRVIHGRARAYPADGQLRIWDIGTHHTFSPDVSSQGTVMKFLDWHGSK